MESDEQLLTNAYIVVVWLFAWLRTNSDIKTSSDIWIWSWTLYVIKGFISLCIPQNRPDQANRSDKFQDSVDLYIEKNIENSMSLTWIILDMHKLIFH